MEGHSGTILVILGAIMATSFAVMLVSVYFLFAGKYQKDGDGLGEASLVGRVKRAADYFNAVRLSYMRPDGLKPIDKAAADKAIALCDELLALTEDERTLTTEKVNAVIGDDYGAYTDRVDDLFAAAYRPPLGRMEVTDVLQVLAEWRKSRGR